MKAFLDTSALLKLYHWEKDSENLMTFLSTSVEEIILSEIAILEFRSALWRKAREDEIKETIVNEVVSFFQKDFSLFRWIHLYPSVIEKAANYLMMYGKAGLRTLDSIQLASAVSLKNENCVFITFDTQLQSFFREENLQIV